MKEYACGDVVPGCGATMRADTEDEVLALCTLHARHAHGLVDDDMSDDLIASIRSVIRTV